MTARKDWEEAKKRQDAFQKKKAGNSDSPRDVTDAMPSSTSEPSNIYNEDVDDLRCILYAHGGGYYFGSLDQERYLVSYVVRVNAKHVSLLRHCLQRLARKIKGRVFGRCSVE